ncbi:MAG: hypothetical protein K1Y36_19335 [Blastocatellia bacterium]|nr:hypothetical protein [Blastocatellia bacterium]
MFAHISLLRFPPGYPFRLFSVTSLGIDDCPPDDHWLVIHLCQPCCRERGLLLEDSLISETDQDGTCQNKLTTVPVCSLCFQEAKARK